MALTYSDIQELGKGLPAFSLPDVGGKTVSSADYGRTQVLTVVIMCNHCPYVLGTIKRVVELATEFKSKGVEFLGISSNDAERYPEDDFPKMKEFSLKHSMPFPYLFDESQSVAKAFNAACTPDFMVYRLEEGMHRLRYHGRLDDSWQDPAKVTRQDLRLALDEILGGRDIPVGNQVPSMGCSIKWKHHRAP